MHYIGKIHFTNLFPNALIIFISPYLLYLLTTQIRIINSEVHSQYSHKTTDSKNNPYCFSPNPYHTPYCINREVNKMWGLKTLSPVLSWPWIDITQIDYNLMCGLTIQWLWSCDYTLAHTIICGLLTHYTMSATNACTPSFMHMCKYYTQ